MSKQEKEIHFGDGVLDEAKRTLNKRTANWTSTIINSLFDLLDPYAKDLPSDIKESIIKIKEYYRQQGNTPRLKPKTEVNIKQQKSVVKIISPDDPNLPPETRVLAARLEGFNEGKDYEYKIAMLALADNNTPKELIVAVRDYIKKREHEWVSKGIDTIEQQYNDKKFLWDE